MQDCELPEWKNGTVEVAELQDLVGRVERATDVLKKYRKSVWWRFLKDSVSELV